MSETQPTTFRKEIYRALRAEMDADPRMLFIGEDVGEYGGAFAVSGDLHELYPERVLNAPISENSYVGMATGAAMGGHRVVTEIMFMDFITLAMDQIVNNAAKVNYMYAGQLKVPLVIRTPYGGYRGYGPSHSQSLASWFMSVPGLKVVVPSEASHVGDLLRRSVADENPVLFLEHKLLYDERLPAGAEDRREMPLGKARVARQGGDVSIVTYGLGVKMARRAAQVLADEDGVEAEIVDMVTLKPYDAETVYRSVRRTGKAVFLEEGVLTGGVGAELCSAVAENCLWELDGGLVRVGAKDLPIPCATTAEKMVLPSVPEVVRAARKAMSV